MYKRIFKRLIDFTIALIGLICVSPILSVVTVLLHFANKGAGTFLCKNDQDFTEEFLRLSSSRQ